MINQNDKLNKELINTIEANFVFDKKPINRFSEVKKENDIIKRNKKDLLENLKKQLNSIENCKLRNNSKNIVLGEGNIDSPIMLIGEAPGEEEDKTGRPFVGAAGILLNKMLNAIGQDRNNTYITNILFWRPPGNRKPTEEEINICLPFVHKHVELVNPNILVLVGAIAAKAFYKSDNGITQIRGNWKNISVGNIKNLKSIAIFHPAFLLRQPARKREAWEDLKKIKIEIDRNT